MPIKGSPQFVRTTACTFSHADLPRRPSADDHRRMLPSQLTHPRLDLGIQLPRMPMRPMRPILQTGQALIPIAANPGMHRFPRNAIPFCDLGDLRSSRQDLHDRVITLLHNAQFHEHRPRPSTRRRTIAPKSNRGRQCYPSTEHRVSPIKRSRTLDALRVCSEFLFFIKGGPCGPACLLFPWPGQRDPGHAAWRPVPAPAPRPHGKAGGPAPPEEASTLRLKEMSSPDGQANRVRGRAHRLRFGRGCSVLTPSTSTRAISPRQGGKLGCRHVPLPSTVAPLTRPDEGFARSTG